VTSERTKSGWPRPTRRVAEPVLARDCTANSGRTRYGRRMVQVRWTSRCLLARSAAWTTLATLLAGTIAPSGVIFEPFCAKQGNTKFDL